MIVTSQRTQNFVNRISYNLRISFTLKKEVVEARRKPTKFFFEPHPLERRKMHFWTEAQHVHD